MQVFAIFVLAWLLLTLAIAAIPMRMEIKYRKHGEDDRLAILLHVWPGIWGYKLEVPEVQWRWEDWLPYLRLKAETDTSTGQTSAHEVKIQKVPPLPRRMLRKLITFVKMGVNILRINRRFYRAIRCHRLKWVTEVGLEDAALTGMLVGGLWTLKGWAFANLQRTVRVEFSRPEFEVIPSFQQPKVNLDFNCIFAIHAGHIMLAGLRIFWILLKSTVELRG